MAERVVTPLVLDVARLLQARPEVAAQIHRALQRLERSGAPQTLTLIDSAPVACHPHTGRRVYADEIHRP